MVLWSPSSWALWKKCPAKYRIKKVERWLHPDLKEDQTFARLAIPGLVVDRLLQFWIHRKQFRDKTWLDDNFEMVWRMVLSEIKPEWNELEAIASEQETKSGLAIAIRMLDTLEIERYDLHVQPEFVHRYNERFTIVGRADLLMIEKESNQATLIDFKNSHSRERVTKDQLLFYQRGLRSIFGCEFTRSGYLMFNPRLEQWKWFKLTEEHEEKFFQKIDQAAVSVEAREFTYRWNNFSCSRFCEVRFGCEMFKQRLPQEIRRTEAA